MKLKNAVRILHCADIHLGKGWNDYVARPQVQRALQEARMDSLRRIVREANDRHCHFLVVAGDLFDKLTVPSPLIRETVEVLAKTEGTVIVLPGNHDYYDGPSNSLWTLFVRHIADSDKFVFLTESMSYPMMAGDQPVVFYPGICPSKHSPTHSIGWVAGERMDKAALNIGIAHGNVEGRSLDHEDRYFTMDEAELRQSGVDAWLLGHIHVPYPARATAGHPFYFFSGTSAPDGFKCRHRGWAWALEFTGKEAVQMELIDLDSIGFLEKEADLNSLADIKQLEKDLAENKARLMLRLTVKGRLSQEEMTAFRAFTTILDKECLCLDLRQEGLLDRIDEGYIDAFYPKDSIAHRLLMDLNRADEAGLALHLAHKLMERSTSA